MITLALDASTHRGTVAVLDDTRVLVEASVPMRSREGELLMPAVARSLRDAGCTARQVNRIVCGAGPGSFTSLRIAASIAKGLTVGCSIPLFEISSLALIVAANVSDGPRPPHRYLAVLDALRGESYVAEFEHGAGEVRAMGAARRVATDAVMTIASEANARAVGPDQTDGWLPHARGLALLEAALGQAAPVDVASWEPSYGRLAEAQAQWEATHSRPLPR